jgi:hypothetical protein
MKWCVTLGIEVDFEVEAETMEDAIREAEDQFDPTAYDTEVVQAYELENEQ